VQLARSVKWKSCSDARSLRNKITVSIVRWRNFLNTDIFRQKIWRQLLKPLETAILLYGQHHVTIVFANIREGTLRPEEITRLFVCFVQELTVNILCFMKIQTFLQLCKLPHYLHPSVLWPTSAGNVSSKQCFMLRAERVLYCEYILQLYGNRGQWSWTRYRCWCRCFV